MDKENRELFTKLLSKRKKLLDAKGRLLKEFNNDGRPLNSRDKSEKHLDDAISQIVPDKTSDGCAAFSYKGDNGDIAEQMEKDFEYKYMLDEAPHEDFCDYDSDDSIKDKDFVPDYDSSCSHISGSSDSSGAKQKIAQVRRRLFTPIKKRKVENNDTPKNLLQTNHELITLEDLLGPIRHSNEQINSFSDDEIVIRTQGNIETTSPPSPQKCHSSTQIVTVAMIHNYDDPGVSANGMTTKNDDRNIIPYKDSYVTNTANELAMEHRENNMDELNSQTNANNISCSGIIFTASMDGIIYIPHDVNPSSQNYVMPGAKTRKRTRNLLNWQRVSAKLARAKGSPYHSYVSKKCADVKGRELKSPCSCKMKCYEKITHANRLMIFKQFWKISHSWEQRRQFVARTVTKKTKNMMKTTGDLGTDRRKFTYSYSLLCNLDFIKVCKVMYLNTLCIGESFVRVSLDKQLEGGMTIPDKRGKHTPTNKTPEVVIQSVIDHINSYPSYESHYSREKTSRKFLGPDLNIPTMYKHYQDLMAEKGVAANLIAKAWIYRNIFNTTFNLSFKLPSVDTCDDCDLFQRKISDVTDETEKTQLIKQKKEHDTLAAHRYELKRQDKEESRTSQGKKVVLMVDMQKCMPTPSLTNSKSFYLRKLWTLNFTIFDWDRNVATNMIWSENVGARGGNEVASCLIRWAEESHDVLSSAECITIWSDNCGGQNRNSMVVMAYMWLMHKYPHIKVINHKFMLKGHTHMEVDQVHSQIEKKKKQLKTMQIAIPRDWSQFIRTCDGKRKFRVFDMELTHFKDLTTLHKRNAPFVLRKKAIGGNDFKISECVWFQLRMENPGILFFKYSFEDDFSQISFLRNVAGNNVISYPNDLPNVRNVQKPISDAKYQDLLKLLEWVPVEYHAFYKNLPHNDKETDFPQTD